jgi:predicted nuclease of predicted toxin-antitoxin system
MPEKHQTPSLRVLLDENVDCLLKSHFDSAFEVVTVPELGWAGLGDGDILHRADEQFDVLVTMDQNLPCQQNLSDFEVAVVVLDASSNAFSDVVELMPKVNEQVRNANAREATVVAA